jgi:spore maturation protein SpmB
MLFLVIGALKRVKVYEAFVEGAKEGFDVAKNLLPYLVAMLVAVGAARFRRPGAGPGRYPPCGELDGPGQPLRRGPAHRAGQAVLWQRGAGHADRDHADHGVDSFPALVAATIQGSTETTFYVLAVYFGAVGIQRVRHAVGCALLAELSGVVAAIFVCYWFFA